MEILYASEKVKKQCESQKEAKKLFGGDQTLVVKLLSRINALEQAETLKDIIALKTFRFHNLEKKHGRNLEGFFAIDVKTSKEPWRIILRSLNEDKQEFDPCRIDEIAEIVEIVEVAEVSKHYG